MRLRPVAGVFAAVIALSGRAAAQDQRAGAWVSVYSSSDHVVVVSPQVSAHTPVASRVDVEAGYEADVISAASVDVVAAASPRGYSEVRQGGALGATWRPVDGTSVGARWLPSWEPDYESQTATLAASREWGDRRLSTELGLRGSLDAVGRRGAPRESWRSLHSGSLTVGVAWTFSPRTVGQATYELQLLDGFQASAYRFVPIQWPGAAAPFGVAENDPDTRVRQAFALALRHALTPRWFVRTSIRAYRDSWEVVSLTNEAELNYALRHDWFVAGISGRVYEQSAAGFYEEHYVALLGLLPQYRTADKLLTRQWSALAGVRASLGLANLGPCADLRITGKLELYEQRFFEFARLPWLQAVVASLGAAAQF
jgi:hypothetical protein